MFIARKEDLVESSTLYTDASSGLPVYDVCPRPWGRRRIWWTAGLSGSTPPVDSTYVTKAEWEIGQPYLYARCGVLHLDDEPRETLARMPLELPYQRFVYELIQFDESAWIVGNQVSKVLETRGFFDALFIRFWHEARDVQNKYRDTLAPGGYEWVNNISLIVNGVERVFSWDPKHLRQLASHTQLERDIRDPLYYMIFGRPQDHEPAGSLFLSRTHKVSLRFTIGALPVDPATRSRYVYVYLMGVAWNILDIKNGRAAPRFAD
jgi:hypothetical protein